MPLYKRNPFSRVKGFTQFKRNMQKMALMGDGNVLKQGFVGIAEDMRYDMNLRLNSNLAAETAKYLKWKNYMMKKRKSGATHVTSLRNKGVVAKAFGSKGKSKSFVAIHYKYAPHAWWIEHGTQERVQKTTGRNTGKVPARKFEYFRPVVNQWRRSGRYVQRVERAVRTAVDVQAKGMR
jgi:hypothetical protein